MPCIFVAKREVHNWPIFGLFARCGGTIFIDRQSRASTDEVAKRITAALRSGVPVMLFPEGTSTDGSTILRFHPSLLQPAVDLATPIAPAAIAYQIDGAHERDVCYYGDIRFAPHLFRLLGGRGICSTIEIHPDSELYADRKSAALGLREKVAAIRSRMSRTPARSHE